MKNINEYILEERRSNSPSLFATYYFKADNKENGYVHNANNAHPDVSNKFLNIVKKHYVGEVSLDKARLDKEGHESVLKIGYVFHESYFTVGTKLFDDVDKMIKELADINDISFIEYQNDEDYKTN